MAFEDSPGLNLGHGFMHYIRQRQFARADEERSFEHLRLRHQAAYIDFSNRSSLVEPPPISHSILKNIQDQKENISLAYEMSSLSVTDKNNNQDQKENTSLASETSSNLVTDKTKSPLKIKKPSRPIYQPPGLCKPGKSPTTGNMSASSSLGVMRQRTLVHGRAGFMELDLKEVDLEQYVEDAQPSVLKALHDPLSLPPWQLTQVAEVVVNRAWEDTTYFTTAAKICQFIVEKERQHKEDKTIPQLVFRRSMVSTMQDLLSKWNLFREHSVQYWLAYCRFVTEAYKLIRPGGQHLTALTNLLYDTMTLLSKPPCVNNFEEVELLCSIFYDCGRKLHRDSNSNMSQLVCLLRDAFLDSGTSEDTSGMLMQLIELQAGGWQLSECAKKFYFNM